METKIIKEDTHVLEWMSSVFYMYAYIHINNT